MEPIKELPEDITSWKAFRRIMDILTDSVSDEIMNLVEYLNTQKGIVEDFEDQEKSDEFYERFEEPVEELIWDAIAKSLIQSD